MRNLKRALSLGLTATMISGLMVMGSSAASYADVTSKNHQEAIEVLKSVGIMTGDEKGNFNPEAKVTRNEMAVVMSNLMAYNVKTYANTSPFTDVPDWAEPYVAACYTNGITSGYDKLTYGGSDNVTTAQAALMVMKALGYFQFQSDFGADWQLSTVAQGNKIDLFEDVDSPVKEAINRNELAQLVLNALESGTVEADDDTIKVNADGVTVEAGKVKYNYITSTKDYAKAIKEVRSTSDTSDAGSYVVELGEKLYDGDLTKDRTGDDFGRPSNKWEYQAKEVGTYPDSADHTFTAKVTSKALYNAIGKTAAENYDMNVYFNGEPVDKYGKGDLYKNKADDDSDFVAYADASDDALTANGVVTEVFVDGTDEVVTVAIMEQYAAEVLKVDEEDGTITLSDLSKEDKADAKDEFETTEFAEDDVVIYTYANDKIQSVYAAEKIEGDVTSVRVKTTANNEGKNTFEGDGDNFTVDGTTYKYNKTMVGDEKLQTENVNNGVVAYLDAQGYVAYIDESAVSYDYAYVLSMGSNNNQFGGSDTYYARLVLTDGTMIKVETDANNTDLVGHIVSYSKDKKDVYSLSDRSSKEATAGQDELHAAPSLEINNGKASFKAETKADGTPALYTANAKTIFIVADTDPDYDDYDYAVYTGVKNVPDIDAVRGGNTEAVVAVKEGNVAKVVYIEDADVSGSGDVIFVKADKTPNYTKDQDGKIFELDAIIGGEAKTLKIKEGSTAAKRLITDIAASTNNMNLPLDDNGDTYLVALKGITENADGIVTSVRLYNEDGKTGDLSGVITGSKITKKSMDDVVSLGTDAARTWSEDVVVAQYNDKSNSGEFESSKISSLKEDKNDLYIAVLDENVITGICTVFVDDDAQSGGSSSQGNNWKAKVIDVNPKNGRFTVDFTYDRPEYVPEDVAVTLTFDVYEDGYKTAISDTVYIPAGKTTATYKSPITKVVDPEAEVEVQVTNEAPAAVSIRYYNGSTEVKPADLFKADSYDTVANVGVSTIKYQLDSTATSGAKVEVKQGSSTLATSASINPSTADRVTLTTAVAGTNYVDVIFTGLDSLVENYTVTNLAEKKLGEHLSTYAGKAKDVNFKVEANRTTVASDNNAVKLTATLGSAIADGADYGLEIILTNGVKFVFVNDGSQTTADAVHKVTANETLAVKSVKEIATPTMLSTGKIVVNDNDGDGKISDKDTFVVKFSAPLKAAPALSGSAGMTATAKGFNAGDTEVTYEVGGTVADGTFTLAAKAIETEDGIKSSDSYTKTINVDVDTINGMAVAP